MTARTNRLLAPEYTERAEVGAMKRSRIANALVSCRGWASGVRRVGRERLCLLTFGQSLCLAARARQRLRVDQVGLGACRLSCNRRLQLRECLINFALGQQSTSAIQRELRALTAHGLST